MTKATDDFYSGFEGEPEIRFLRVRQDGTQSVVSMWQGYFDNIMSLIEPGEAGWSGLALPYHLHEGWYDEPWEITTLEPVIQQWGSIDVSRLGRKAQAAHAAVQKLLVQAHRCQDRVWITYS